MRARTSFDRNMRQQFHDQMIEYRYVFAVHRLSQRCGWLQRRMISLLSQWGERESAGPAVVVNENVGRSLEIAFDSISDPNGSVRHGTRNYVTAVLARRAGYFYFILSRTFGLSTRIYTSPPSSPFRYSEARSACKGWWNKIRRERDEERGTVT